MHIYAASFLGHTITRGLEDGGRIEILSKCSFIFSAHFSLNLSIVSDLNRRLSVFRYVSLCYHSLIGALLGLESDLQASSFLTRCTLCFGGLQRILRAFRLVFQQCSR